MTGNYFTPIPESCLADFSLPPVYEKLDLIDEQTIHNVPDFVDAYERYSKDSNYHVLAADNPLTLRLGFLAYQDTPWAEIGVYVTVRISVFKKFLACKNRAVMHVMERYYNLRPKVPSGS